MKKRESNSEIPSLEWLSRHANDPEYDALFEQLLEETEIEASDTGIETVRASLNSFIEPSSVRRCTVRRVLYWTSCVAACVAVVALFLSWNFFSRSDIEWHEVYSEVGETRHVELPDGTRLCMNSDTKLIYPSAFTRSSRNIYVDGEIYADVTKDEKRPFVITSNTLKVKVLGTKLRVKSYIEDCNAEVALISGKVEVQAGDAGKVFNRVLKPGQMVRYNKEICSIEDYKVNDATGFWNHDNSIRFVNESLGDIAADLERRFGVDIIIEGKTLANMQYYASFVNGESLESILQTLNASGSMKISKLNDAYIITSVK